MIFEEKVLRYKINILYGRTLNPNDGEYMLRLNVGLTRSQYIRHCLRDFLKSTIARLSS